MDMVNILQTFKYFSRRILKIFILISGVLVVMHLMTKVVVVQKLVPAAFENPTVETLEDHWQYLGDPSLKYQIYSAYFDYRANVFTKNYSPPTGHELIGGIRVITILHLSMDKNFIFCNYQTSDGSWTEVKPISIIYMNDYMWTKYIATFVICPVTKHVIEKNVEFPEMVGITYDKEKSMTTVTGNVKVKYPQHKLDLDNPPAQKNEIVVCATPAYKYTNALRLVEYVELWRELGATKFYFYNKTISANVDKVVRYFQKRGDMTVLNWTLEGYKFKSELRTEGLFAAFHDCLYRALIIDNLKYLAMSDYDEFLMPRDGSVNLFHFMEKRDNATVNSFNFRNAFLLNGLPEKYSPVPKDANNTQLFTQLRIGRISNTSYYLNHHIRSKYITKTKFSLELGNHFLFKAVEGTQEYRVPLEEGMSYHYRDNWGYKFCIPNNTEHDYTARLYGKKLWKLVDQDCAEIFKDGLCPSK